MALYGVTPGAMTVSVVSAILLVVVGTTNAVLFGVLVWMAVLVLRAWVLLIWCWPWSADDGSGAWQRGENVYIVLLEFWLLKSVR